MMSCKGILIGVSCYSVNLIVLYNGFGGLDISVL